MRELDYYRVLRRYLRIVSSHTDVGITSISPKNEIEVANFGQTILFSALRGFEVGDYNYGSERLKDLVKICNMAKKRYSGPLYSSMILSSGRVAALGLMWKKAYKEAVFSLQRDINNCPIMDGKAIPGMVDTLIVLSDAYSIIGNKSDALQSARLAVNVAHDRLEVVKSYEGTKLSTEMMNSIVLNASVCAILDAYTAVSMSYLTLARRLEDNDMGQLSVEWYERAFQSASKFNLDGETVQELWGNLGQSKMDFLHPPIVVGRKHRSKPVIKKGTTRPRSSEELAYRQSNFSGPAPSKEDSKTMSAFAMSLSSGTLPEKPVLTSSRKPKRPSDKQRKHGRKPDNLGNSGIQRGSPTSSSTRPKSAQSKLQGGYRRDNQERSISEFASVSENEGFENLVTSEAHIPQAAAASVPFESNQNEEDEEKGHHIDISEDAMHFERSQREAEMKRLTDIPLVDMLKAYLAEAMDEGMALGTETTEVSKPKTEVKAQLLPKQRGKGKLLKKLRTVTRQKIIHPGTPSFGDSDEEEDGDEHEWTLLRNIHVATNQDKVTRYIDDPQMQNLHIGMNAEVLVHKELSIDDESFESRTTNEFRFTGAAVDRSMLTWCEGKIIRIHAHDDEDILSLKEENGIAKEAELLVVYTPKVGEIRTTLHGGFCRIPIPTSQIHITDFGGKGHRRAFRTGHLVYARKNGVAWHPGEILEVTEGNEGNPFHTVLFDEGDTESGIPRSNVKARSLNTEAIAAFAPDLLVGVRVWVNYHSSRFRRLQGQKLVAKEHSDGKWVKGVILTANPTKNLYMVGYPTGETEPGVHRDDIIKVDGNPDPNLKLQQEKGTTIRDESSVAASQAERLRKIIAMEMETSVREVAAEIRNTDTVARNARRLAVRSKAALMVQSHARSRHSRLGNPHIQSMVENAKELVRMEVEILRRQAALVENYENLVASVEKHT